MSQDSQPGDYVVFGTPLHVEEEDSFRAHAFQKKEVKDAATVKALPVWQQEVVDAEGRQRFHGAFTGGWSAGYYNTAGSAEGWAPAAFKSSRAERGDVRKQAVEDFLDEDELVVARSTTVQANPEFDTFGGTAAEMARRAAAEDAAARPGAMPNLMPDELLVPVADSIGIRLLQAMGWRQGKGVGSARRGAEAATGGSKWGRVAGVGPDDDIAPYILEPKDNVHGLGFDPYKGAEEFRDAKRARDGVGEKLQPLPPTKRQRGVAFGSGVADEDDVYGMVEDYATGSAPRAREAQRSSEYHFELSSDDEDTGPLLSSRGGREREAAPQLLGRPTPLQLTAKDHGKKPGDFIAGFTPKKAVVHLPYFPPPVVPAGFVARHVFLPPPPPMSAPPASMAVPEPNEVRFRRDLQQLLFQFAARSRAAAQNEPGRRSAPLGSSEEPAQHVSGFAQPVSQRPGVAGSSAVAPHLASEPFLAATGVLEASFIAGSTQDMGMGGGLPHHVGLRPGVPRQTLPAPPPAPIGISFQSAGTLDKPVSTVPTTPGVRARPVRSCQEWRPAPLLCKRLDVMDPYRGKKAPLAVQAPKQGIAGALFELGSTQQEVAAQQQQGITARAGRQAQPGSVLPPPPTRPAQVIPELTARFAASSLPAASAAPVASDATGFLDSLELLPPPPPAATPGFGDALVAADEIAGSQQQVAPSRAPPSEVNGDPVPEVPAPQERPIDLFKAIFEADVDDEDDDEDEDEDEDEEDLEVGPPRPVGHAAEEKLTHGSGWSAAGGTGTTAAIASAPVQKGDVSLAAITASAPSGNSGEELNQGAPGTAASGAAPEQAAAEGVRPFQVGGPGFGPGLCQSPARPALDVMAAAKRAEQKAITAALSRVREAQKKGKKDKKERREKKGKKDKRQKEKDGKRSRDSSESDASDDGSDASEQRVERRSKLKKEKSKSRHKKR